MNPIFQTLLTMTATASVVALAVMVLRLPLKKAPRWITCCLWVVVFLRMVCPVSFSLPVSLVPASIAQGTYLQIPAAQEPNPPGQTPVQAEVSSPVVAPADTAPGQASAPETAQAAPPFLAGCRHRPLAGGERGDAALGAGLLPPPEGAAG